MYMCGLLGFIGEPREGQWGETHRLLEAMFLASEPRGIHATGFAAIARPFKRPYQHAMIIEKQPVKASRFIRSSGHWRGLRHRRCTAVVGHVRWATHGDPIDNQNNHPHACKQRRFFLAHNGIISNHHDIARRFGLSLETDCDSEVLLRIIELVEDPAEGIALCLRHVRGSMAVAMYDAEDDSLWLATDGGRPLWLMKMRNDRRYFFASTRDILVDSVANLLGDGIEQQFEMLFPVATHHVHVIRANGVFESTGRVDSGANITGHKGLI